MHKRRAALFEVGMGAEGIFGALPTWPVLEINYLLFPGAKDSAPHSLKTIILEGRGESRRRDTTFPVSSSVCIS